jgi:NitT/TauT family transport system permease protein
MSAVPPVAVDSTATRALGGVVGRRLRDWIPALAVLVIVIGGWQLAVPAFGIKKFLLPQPSTIWNAFWDNHGDLLHAGWLTFQQAFFGFLIGSGAAILLALVLARWRALGRAIMPYAIAANAIPIIAFAPIMNAWFSPFGKSSKIAIAAALCFFPVLVNTLRGLSSVRPQSLELMRSYAAGELEIFRRVRFPTALPFIFTGLKVATVLAMIGAVVGEYFGGALNALGVLILTRARVFQFNEAWAGIVVACLMGLVLYIGVAALERLTLRWVPSTSE